MNFCDFDLLLIQQMGLFVGIHYPLITFCRKYGQHLLDLPLNDDLRGIIDILSFGENKPIASLGKPDYNFFWDNKLAFCLSDLEEINIFGQLKKLEQPFSSKHHLDLRVVRNKDGIHFFVGHEYEIDGYFALIDPNLLSDHKTIEDLIKNKGLWDDYARVTLYCLV